jgi:hypothetical protein
VSRIRATPRLSGRDPFGAARRKRDANVGTKRELVDLALRGFGAARRQRNLAELFGRVEIDPDYDYKALRREDA